MQLLALLCFQALCVLLSQGDKCSVLKIVRDYELEATRLSESATGLPGHSTPTLPPALTREDGKDSRESNRSKGAIVNTFSGNISDITLHYRCQIRTQQEYARRMGYAHYIVEDNAEWAKERKEAGIYPHWLKVQVLRALLGEHSWVLYLDMDAVFTNISHTPSIESSVLSKAAARGMSVFVPQRVGWSSHMMFFVNTDYSRRFLDHLWDLRSFCPDGTGAVREQGAVHIAMLEALLLERAQAILRYNLSDAIDINRDQGRQCCAPRDHCHYPHGRKSKKPPSPTNAVQGCTWNWQNKLYSIKNGTNHRHVTWDFVLIEILGVEHPVKDMTC